MTNKCLKQFIKDTNVQHELCKNVILNFIKSQAAVLGRRI